MTNKSRQPLYHDQCQALLPSFINGKLDAAQQRQVQEHLAQCDLCFAELQQAQQVANAVSDAPVELESMLTTSRMEQNLDDVLQRIEETESGKISGDKKQTLVSISAWRKGWSKTPAASKTLVWAQAACLVVAVGFLAKPSVEDRGVVYETFSTDNQQVVRAAEQNQVYRVIFHPAATEVDMRNVLNNVDAQIISGPSKAGLYTISTLKSSAQQEAVLHNLRASPWIKLAEPSVHSSKATQRAVQ